MPTTLIVDGAALFARAYYVDTEDPVRSVTRSARTLLERISPNLLLWAWDGEGRKSDKPRKLKPANYSRAMTAARLELQDKYGGESYVAEEGEADDVIASAAVNERRQGNDVVIATADGDLDYLCVTGIRVYSLIDKSYKEKDAILKKWSVAKLSHIPLVKAMVGDAGDGIKGVPRIGKVKASQIYESCVTPNMKFEEAKKAIEGALTPEQRGDYASALRAVILYACLKVPNAQPCNAPRDY